MAFCLKDEATNHSLTIFLRSSVRLYANETANAHQTICLPYIDVFSLFGGLCRGNKHRRYEITRTSTIYKRENINKVRVETTQPTIATLNSHPRHTGDIQK